MPSYLYYRRDDEWVRVEADNYSQITTTTTPEFEGGQCCGDWYNVKGTVDHISQTTGDVNVLTFNIGGVITNRLFGPVRGLVMGVDSTGRDRLFIAASDINCNYLLYTARTASSGRYLANGRISSVTQLNSPPRDCGNPASQSTCETTFTLNGLTVLALPTCPEVTNGQDDCSDCCAQLLPIARSITI